MDKYLFMDTSALMHATNELQQLIDEGAILVVCSTVLDELDKHKDCDNGEKRYKARQAFKLLNNNDSIKYIVNEVPDKFTVETLFYGFDMNQADNKILYACVDFIDANKNAKVVLITNDNGMIAKANMLKIESLKLVKAQDEEMYKGFIELFGTEEENDNALYDMMENPESLHANQYVILHDSDTEQVSAVRWDAKAQEFVDVKFRTTKVKPLNIYQECAMDLLYNDAIPIKVIAGNYGSGKSLLSMKIMEEKIYTGLYDKMLLLRNPIAVDAIDIGALPGDFHSKLGHFFSPMVQYLTNDTMFDYKEAFDPKNEEAAKRRGYQLDMDIVQNLKGISVDRTIVILDEAEDLSLKLIKVAGTRIGRGSMLVMMGDIKNQTEDKYKYDNGLSAFIEQSKDEPLVGVIYLPMDVRSEMSKIFADLK
jgi:predicted ribonuclease YlaK